MEKIASCLSLCYATYLLIYVFICLFMWGAWLSPSHCVSNIYHYAGSLFAANWVMEGTATSYPIQKGESYIQHDQKCLVGCRLRSFLNAACGNPKSLAKSPTWLVYM